MDPDHARLRASPRSSPSAGPTGRFATTSFAAGTCRRRRSSQPGSGSIVRFGGDKLLLMSDRGKLSIARATPQSIELLSQADVLDGREIWSTPLLYAGRLYAKGDAEFVCFDMTGKVQAAQARASSLEEN